MELWLLIFFPRKFLKTKLIILFGKWDEKNKYHTCLVKNDFHWFGAQSTDVIWISWHHGDDSLITIQTLVVREISKVNFLVFRLIVVHDCFGIFRMS